MSDDYRIISTTAFPLITEVRVYEETIDHIREEHPEVPIDFPSIFHGLTSTIQSPSAIEAGKREGTFVYVAENSTNASGDPFRIPVKVIEGTSGLLKTAFFATPGSPGKIVWSRKSKP